MNAANVRGYLKHLFFILAAMGVGASSVAPLIDWDTVEFTPASLIPILYAFGRAAWLEYSTIKAAKNDSLP